MSYSLLHSNLCTTYLGNQPDSEDCHTWDSRFSALVKMILNTNADVVCLQELRNLDDAEKKIRDFLYEVGSVYDHCVAPYNSGRNTFYLAILYKSSKFTLCDTQIVSLGDLPDENLGRRVCLGAKLQDKETHESFWAYTTHFHMAEELKTKSVNTLAQVLSQKTEPWVLTGDFNFFYDKEGQEQFNVLQDNSGGRSITYPLKLVQDGVDTQLDGTFHGYSYDKFNSKAQLTDQSITGLGKLDEIFVSGLNQVETCQVVGFALDDITSHDGYEGPSDHLALLTHVKFI